MAVPPRTAVAVSKLATHLPGRSPCPRLGPVHCGWCCIKKSGPHKYKPPQVGVPHPADLVCRWPPRPLWASGGTDRMPHCGPPEGDPARRQAALVLPRTAASGRCCRASAEAAGAWQSSGAQMLKPRFRMSATTCSTWLFIPLKSFPYSVRATWHSTARQRQHSTGNVAVASRWRSRVVVDGFMSAARRARCAPPHRKEMRTLAGCCHPRRGAMGYERRVTHNAECCVQYLSVWREWL